MKGRIRIKIKALETWLKGNNGMTQTQFAKEIGEDDGNFSKYVNDELEPTKAVIKKMMFKTGYGFDALFDFDRNAESEDNGK